jgi:hypothetical protein
MNTTPALPNDLPGEIIKNMEEQFPWLVESPDLDTECPEWFMNVLERLLKTISPNIVNLFEDDEDSVTPDEAGEMMGLVYSFMTTSGNLIENSEDSVLGPKDQFLKALTVLSNGTSSNALDGFQQIAGKVKDLTGDQFKVVIAKDPGSLSEFTEAFSSSAKRGIISDDGSRLSSESEATPIYIQLLVFGTIWQEKLQSLDELHRLLCHCMGSNVVGDFGRLRKLCNRVKYSIGKRGHSPKRKRDIDEIALSVFEGLREAQARLDDNIK